MQALCMPVVMTGTPPCCSAPPAILAETRAFTGTVNFIFQPGEEGMGGALAMLEEGLFEKFPCDEIFGMHNRPGAPLGALLQSHPAPA